MRADAKDFLTKLLMALRGGLRIRRKDYVVNELRELWVAENNELEGYYRDAGGLIKPWEVIRAVREVFSGGGSTVFIGDVGAHRIESFLMPIYDGESYITSTSYVSMGLAVPGAVAAR